MITMCGFVQLPLYNERFFLHFVADEKVIVEIELA